LCTSELGKIGAACLSVGERMAVVNQVLQHCFEFVVEILDACVLVKVQVQKVTECVVVSREAEFVESLIKCFEHLLRVVIYGRQWWADLEHILHHFFRQRKKYVKLDLAILSYP
jgi:predicted cation transporter